MPHGAPRRAAALENEEIIDMGSFTNITALFTLALAVGAAGCVAEPGDEETEDGVGEAASADQAATTTPAPCIGPGTLLANYGFPPTTSTFPAPLGGFGGFLGTPWPGHIGPFGYGFGGFWPATFGGLGTGFGSGFFPNYYPPTGTAGLPICGCPPTT